MDGKRQGTGRFLGSFPDSPASAAETGWEYCNLLLPCTIEEIQESQDSGVSSWAGTASSVGPWEVLKPFLSAVVPNIP